jgi:hypothetical protein
MVKGTSRHALTVARYEERGEQHYDFGAERHCFAVDHAHY